MRVEVIRRRPPRFEPLPRRHDVGIGGIAERVPERARPIPGESIKFVLAEADERAFQHRGE
jgi:hypothetical protein